MQLKPTSPITAPRLDRLGRWPFARAIANLIDLADPNGAIVIGVEGAWGAGKSSVLELVAHALAGRRGHRIVRLSAWRTSARDEFLASLTYSITLALVRHWEEVWPWLLIGRLRNKPLPLWIGFFLPLFTITTILFIPAFRNAISPYLTDDPAKIAAAVGLVGAPALAALATQLARPLAASAASVLSNDDARAKIGSMEAFAYEFDILAHAQRRGRRFVVLVEDLDRCAPDRVAEVLSAIAQICGHERAGAIGFLLAYDHDKVIKSLSRSVAQDSSDNIADAEAYLHRIVHLELPLPPLKAGQESPPKDSRQFFVPTPVRGALASYVIVAVTLMLIPRVGLPASAWWTIIAAAVVLVIGPCAALLDRGRNLEATSDWKRAEEDAAPLLPLLPRDRARVVNQAIAVRLLDEDPDPLTAWQALTLSAFVTRWPRSFSLGPLIDALPHGFGANPYENAELAKEIETRSSEGLDMNHFREVERVHRFVSRMSRVRA